MKITHTTKIIQQPKKKMHVLFMTKHQFGQCRQGQNFDEVMFWVTIVEMILTGLKNKTT